MNEKKITMKQQTVRKVNKKRTPVRNMICRNVWTPEAGS